MAKHLVLNGKYGFSKGGYSKTYQPGTRCIVYLSYVHNSLLDHNEITKALKDAQKFNKGAEGPPRYVIVIIAGELLWVLSREYFDLVESDEPDPPINPNAFKQHSLYGMPPVPLDAPVNGPGSAAAPTTRKVKKEKVSPQRSLFE